MSRRTVAVFTEQLDVTADAVILELNKRGVPVFRCDPADFPDTLSVCARLGESWAGHIRTPTRTLDLASVVCAWWRRPGRTLADPSTPEHEWVSREANAAFRGLLSTLPWLNAPDIIRTAEHKPLQLVTAARVGLRIPSSLITNDPDEARNLLKEHPAVIYKSLTSGILTDGRVIYASPVDADSIDDSVRLTSHLFQQRIEKEYELRITAVDRKFFAARIDTHSEKGGQDWRSDYQNLTYSRAVLPPDTISRLREFMRLLHLRFAAIDMIVTPEGDHVFLEANPNGQWAWIEEETGFAIASAIADALEGPHK